MSEEWHKTHAVLLKSVAQAQGVLLAGLNALETKLTAMQVEQGKNQIKADLAHGTVLKECGEIRGMVSDVFQQVLLVKFSAQPKRKSKRKPRGRGK
jgi:hypothetical protein